MKEIPIFEKTVIMSFHINRPLSGSSKRSNSAGEENKNLRDAIGKLQQELLHSRTDTQKAKDQLNCLILLVKRSWSGDREASLHVANIVGAAPPDISGPQSYDNPTTYTIKPKSRAVNNWALLTIGALNRHYKRYEIEIEEQQRTHLIRRIGELEDHLLHNRDLQVKLQHDLTETESQNHKQCQEIPRRQSLQKQNIDNLCQDKPPSAGVRKKPAVRHLYRPAQKEPEQPADICLGDLFMQSNEHKLKNQTNQAFESLYRHKLHSSQNGNSKDQVPETVDLDYDDPKKYVKMSLYESEQMFDEEAFGRRKPQISIEYQRSSDAFRSRPKSSAVSGRPMKYETTRPISAYSKDKKENSKLQNKRIKSAPARSIKHPSSEKDSKSKKATFLTEEKENEEKDLVEIKDLEEEEEEEQEKNSDESSEEENPFKFEAERRKKNDEELRKKIKYPESASEFELEMQKILEMEKDFKKSTLSLQKKLGITPSGLI